MTEASTTRSRSIEDAQLAIDHRRVVALGTHPAGAERVMDADPCRPDMSVDLLIGGFARPQRDLGGDKRLQRRLFRDLADRARSTKDLPR